MAINQLDLAWEQLMKNLDTASCEHCRCDVPKNDKNEHFCMDIVYPCKATLMREELMRLRKGQYEQHKEK
jgi:hypothetical protein